MNGSALDAPAHASDAASRLGVQDLVSAMTGATADRVLADPLVRDFCSAVMLEAADVGARVGCCIDQTPQQRHAAASKQGAFKSSMLQDVQAARSIELNAIVAAV